MELTREPGIKWKNESWRFRPFFLLVCPIRGNDMKKKTKNEGERRYEFS